MAQATQNVTTITRLPTSRVNKQARRVTRATKALKRQAAMATGVGFVACTLTTLSLNHLAKGVELVTHADGPEAWAMAVGIDVGFVALELSQLVINERVRKQISKYSRPAILGTLVGSAVMNSFAFMAQAEGYVMLTAAALLGIAIPGLVYCLTRVAAALALDCHTRG